MIGSPIHNLRMYSMICGFNYYGIFSLSFAERVKTNPHPEQRIVLEQNTQWTTAEGGEEP